MSSVSRVASTFFVSLFVLSVHSVPAVFAQAADEPSHIPGVVEGIGNRFVVSDSSYLNVTVETERSVTAEIESVPDTITLRTEAGDTGGISHFTLTGLLPGVLYHKYQDDYHTYAPLPADGAGTASFDLDTRQSHTVFIQTRKSTKFIQDNPTGGDCAGIGNWDASTKTCTLTSDVNETVQIDNDNITVDGRGHTLTGHGTGSGIYTRKSGVTVRDLTVTGFSYGVNFDPGFFGSAHNNRILSVRLENDSSGIDVRKTNGAVVSDNVIAGFSSTALEVSSSSNTRVTGNAVGSGNGTGISDSSGYKDTFEDNVVTGSSFGMSVSGNACTVRNNRIGASQWDGFSLRGIVNSVVSGNAVSGSGRTNFETVSSDMASNTIDQSNTVEGKPIYYLKNVTGRTFDATSDIGAFYCISCDDVTIRDVTLADHGSRVFFWHTNHSRIENVSSADGTVEVWFYYSSYNTVEKNSIAGLTLYLSSDFNSVFSNNVLGYPVSLDGYTHNRFSADLPIGGNYWKANEANCVDKNGDGFCDAPFVSNLWNDPYPLARPFDSAAPSGSSNVLFLPGLKASRLYKDGLAGTEDQLWLPNYFGNDLEELALDGNGRSVNAVYTRDVLDEVALPIVGANIYKSFLAQLDGLKSEHVINDYEAFAYDWRANVEDIVREGTPYPYGTIRSAIADLDSLAHSSKSKKVTIVTHSTGGLLAKAMMMELEKRGMADKVDKIVFVGTPQMGAPLAMLSLLYGYDESLLSGTLISRSEARTLAGNMPGAYQLLPSERYFERTDGPFVTFSSERTRYKGFRDAYGEGIDTLGEFQSFLTGEGDGRTKPDAGDVDMENTLGKGFLDQAAATHDRLDGWTPPAGVDVIEIAGWGLDTVSGVRYTEKENVRCYAWGGVVPSCTGVGQYEPVYEPQFTVDGDRVVPAPSALMLPESEHVKRYWVNLHDNNKGLRDNRKHRDLLEIDSLRTLLADIIGKKADDPLPEFISVSRPSDYANAKPRLRMALYSPLDIHLYDDFGHHTGPVKTTVDGHEATVFEEGIPNSYYYQYGGRKYVGFEGGEHIRVALDGYDSGSYTLKLAEVRPTDTGEQVVAQTTFENLPTDPGTGVSLDVPATGLVDLSPLRADWNGDGVTDYEVKPVLGGTATLDTLPPEAVIGFDPATRKLDITGTDNRSVKVVVTKTDDSASLIDEAGNKTEIYFNRNNTAGTELKYSLGSITYGSEDIPLTGVSLGYEWALEKTGSIKMLNERATAGDVTMQAHYLAKNNITIIERTKNGIIVSEQRKGLIVFRLATEEGKVKIIY